MSRAYNELRPLTMERNFPTAAPGSVLMGFGETRVLCTASIASDLPSWMRDQENPRGWVTAEYNMMPGCTSPRKRRGNDGRSTEIQRLIGRVLRAAVDLTKMPGLLITCDCDVLKADGGTRTASITGAYIALADALARARADGLLEGDPVISPVAAVSVGVVDGKAVLDLDYPLDSRAEVDMNVAMNGLGEFVEIQGAAENGAFSRDQMNELLDLADHGIKLLIEAQKHALKS